METLQITCVLSLGLAVVAIAIISTYLFTKLRFINVTKQECSVTLTSCKELIASIQSAHNNLVTQTAETAQRLQDLKFFIDASKRK